MDWPRAAILLIESLITERENVVAVEDLFQHGNLPFGLINMLFNSGTEIRIIIDTASHRFQHGFACFSMRHAHRVASHDNVQRDSWSFLVSGSVYFSAFY